MDIGRVAGPSVRCKTMKLIRQTLAVRSPARPACVTLVLAALILSGCATYPMMPTPVLYTGAQAKPAFTNIAADRRTPSLDLLYVTDRAPAASADDASPYTASRSRYLAFGSTRVEFGNGVTWETLVAQSTVADRKVPIDLTLGPTTELGRFPRIPYEIARAGGWHLAGTRRRCGPRSGEAETPGRGRTPARPRAAQGSRAVRSRIRQHVRRRRAQHGRTVPLPRPGVRMRRLQLASGRQQRSYI